MSITKLSENSRSYRKNSIKQHIYRLRPAIKYTALAIALCLILFALISNIKKHETPGNVSSNHMYPVANTPTPQINTPPTSQPETKANVITIYDCINTDINDDHKEDLVELVYSNRNLSLKSASGTHILDEDVSYEHDVVQLPKLLTVRDTKGNKYIFATSVFFTNKIGSTTKGWLYDGRNNRVESVINTEEYKLIDYEALPLADGKVKLALPEIEVEGIFELADEYKDYKYITKESIQLSSHTDYFVNDYNSDGCDEIVTSRRVFAGSVDWFPICYIYTVYNIIDGQFVPIAYFYDDNETKRAILKSIFKYGSVKIDNGKFINAYPEYEKELNENIKSVSDTLHKMAKDNVLTINSDEFYLNIKPL